MYEVIIISLRETVTLHIAVAGRDLSMEFMILEFVNSSFREEGGLLLSVLDSVRKTLAVHQVALSLLNEESHDS